MSHNRLAADVTDVLGETLRGADGDVLVVNPSRTTIRCLVEAVGSLGTETGTEAGLGAGTDTNANEERGPTVRLLAPSGPLKAVMEDFLVAGETADLVAEGSLSIRVLEDRSESSVLVSGDSVTALVYGDERVGGIVTDDPAFVADVRERYDRLWEATEEFSLRTPSLSRVRGTLADEIGAGTAADFDAVLDSLETVSGDGGGLDEVTIALLVAARNGVLLYDISKWGEDVGLASKATFSRTKTELEEAGVIDTEKVPIEVGRPRLRLRLGDGRLRDADSEEFGAVARRVLAE